MNNIDDILDSYNYIPKAINIPSFGEQNRQNRQDYMLYIHLYSIVGDWHWYIAEYDKDTDTAFGFVSGYIDRWTIFSVKELYKAEAEDLYPSIMRDILFKPISFKTLLSNEEHDNNTVNNAL